MPSSLTKSAPEFCSVYVIQKGKKVSVRTAKRPVVNTATPPKQTPSQGLPPFIPTDLSEVENGARHPARETTRCAPEKLAATRERMRSAPMNLSLDNIDIQSHGSGSRCSLSSARNSNADENEFLSPFHPFGSVDISSQNLDFSSALCSPMESSRYSAVSAYHRIASEFGHTTYKKNQGLV